MHLEGTLKEWRVPWRMGREQLVIRAAGQELWEDDRGVERQAPRCQKFFEQGKTGNLSDGSAIYKGLKSGVWKERKYWCKRNAPPMLLFLKIFSNTNRCPPAPISCTLCYTPKENFNSNVNDPRILCMAFYFASTRNFFA